MGRATEPRPPGSIREHGQAIAEFAIVVPLLIFILLAIVDFGRVFTAMLTVEAAAREAADYGTQYPWYWSGDPTDPDSNYAKTEQGMIERACTATKHLTDYAGPDTACTNPSFAFVLDPPSGATAAECFDLDRYETPCNVVVTLDFTFNLIVPVSIPFFGGELGLPSSLSFQRTSTFAISDFEIDAPLAPSPTP